MSKTETHTKEKSIKRANRTQMQTLVLLSLLIATLLIKNPQEAKRDLKESETLDVLRVHFLRAQPEIFVVCET